MAKKNFTITTVATAPSPATTGTSLIVASGDGALFAVNEPAIIFPVNDQPLVANAEIVMVTNVSTDTLTITRTQESTSARTIVAGDIIIQGITAKDWNDLPARAETLTNKTIDGDDNTIQDLAYSSIKSTSRSGSDVTLVTGTKGTSGDLSVWNADGDLVDGPTPPSGTIVGTTDEQTLTNKTLTNPVINFTDTAASQNVKCYAYLSANQENLTSGSDTLVTFNAELYDTGGDFNTGTYKFVAPVTGYYLITASLQFTGVVADKDYQVRVKKGASLILTNINHNGGDTSNLNCLVSGVVALSANDEITVYAIQNSGASTVDIESSSLTTFLCIHLLSL